MSSLSDRALGLPAALALAWLGSAAPLYAADTTAPSVAVVEPQPRAVVRGLIDVDLAALDDAGGLGLRWMEFRVGGAFGRAEWPLDRGRFAWNTRYVQDGEHDLLARAIDAAGNPQDSAATRVRVDNHGVQCITLTAGTDFQLPARGAPGDAGPPWAAMSRPIDGVVGGTTVPLEAFAVDDADGSGIASVEFLVDGAPIGAGAANGSRYTRTWDSTAVPDGRHTLAVRATDGDGRPFDSTAVSVLVDNVPPTLVRLSTYDVMVSPPNLDQGTVRVWVQFDPTGSAMDPGTPPTVEVTFPPGGGTRAVSEMLYLPERGLWIGDVPVNRSADGGAGTAVIEVRDAKDLGGNTMAAVPRAGYIRFVDDNPAPPFAGYMVMNNMGVSYHYGAAPTYRVHEGGDYLGAVGTPIQAVRAGIVQPLHGANPDQTVPVRVEVGTDAVGVPIYQFDVYLHVDSPVAAGTPLNVGDRLGDIGANYPPGVNHTHFYFGDTTNPAGYPRPRRNPLFLYESDADRDPGGNEPALQEGGVDGQTIYLLRQSGPALTPLIPGDPVYGQLVILGEFVDHLGYYAPSYPFSVGYRIRPTRTLGRAVRTEETPYLLSRWFEYDIPFEDQPTFERYVSRTHPTTWHDPATGTAFNWTRYHHALLTHAAGTTGESAARTADQFWYTRADATAARDNGSDAAGAAILLAARFRDGRYTIDLFGADLAVRPDPTGGRRLYTNVGSQEVVVDNYPPYLEELVVRQGVGLKRVRYRGRWEPNAAGSAVTLQPAAVSNRNLQWVHGREEVEITAIFSEPLNAAPTPPALSIKRTDGTQRDEALAVGPVTADRVWTLTISKTDADMTGHRLDSVAGGDTAREVAFSGRDLAGNAVDTNPLTAAFRNEATGMYDPAAYEHAAAAAWGGQVVDLHHALRIDTKHDQKPQLPTRLDPAN